MKTLNYNLHSKVRKLLNFLLLVATLLLTPTLTTAQHWMSQFGHLGNYYLIKAAAETYFSQDTSRIHNKSCGYKDFNRWTTFMESRVDKDGSLKTYSTAMNLAQQQISNRENGDIIPGIWESFGPNTNPPTLPPAHSRLGLISSIWVDNGNFNKIYAGTSSGGLFFSSNGGQNWSCLTEKNIVTGVSDIEIDAQNPDTIYIATGVDRHGNFYSAGVLKSIDSGITWNETDLNPETFQKNYNISDMVQNPLNPTTLFSLVNFEVRGKGAKIMRTINGGRDWTESLSIPEGSDRERLFKIEMHPIDPNIIYVCGSGLYRTINNGSSWVDITNKIVPDLANYYLERAAISINPDNPQKILVIRRMINRTNPDDVSASILLSTDGGENFQTLAVNGFFNQGNIGYFRMELEWSKSLPNVFYIGGLWIHKFLLTSTNGLALRLTIPGDYEKIDSSPNDVYHIDIRELKTYKNILTNEGFIFQGNDGGITMGLEDDYTGASWADISGVGLNITQFYGIGIPNDGRDLVIGGNIDGNLCRSESKNWTLPFSGDAAETVFSFSNHDTVYVVQFGMNHYASISYNGGEDFTGIIDIHNSDPYRRNDAPLEMSSTNSKVLYIGGNNVWRTNNGKDFTKISVFNDPWKLKTIREAPSDPNVIYAAKENRTWNWVDNNHRLYKATNGQPDSPDWTSLYWVDITPNTPEFNLVDKGIFDLAVDPNNPHTFFIALDGFDPGHRIYKCEMVNGVYNWSNYSQGLLNLPVNCLEIYKGNDLEEMFAGTDDGVYYRNKNIQEWQPFGNGLPLTIVSDIEIDYVNNEIVVSTFGRGIYKASLCGLQAQTSDIVVTGTEIWEGLKRIPANITVNTGASLTIKGEVKMNALKEIIVQKGAQLIIDGGKITNQCRNTFWQGIRVHGTKDGPQNLLYQGLVLLRNGAVIQNAKIGILCNNNTIGSGGGIIMAGSSTFRNNVVAVQFEKYTYKSSISTFNLCTFVTDEGFFEGYAPKQFARLNEISGITFNGCSFKNTMGMGNYNYEYRGTGIYSNNSIFVVDHKCIGNQTPCTEYQKSEFFQLEYGIYATSILGTKTFRVNNSFFEYNDCGIYAGATSNIIIKNNEFNVSEYGNKVTGLYLDQCNGYVIEENLFRHFNGLNYNHNCKGIVVNNSGQTNNTIYKNQFKGMFWGIVAQDQNRNKDGSAGLLLKCNKFSNIKTDIAVLKYNPNSVLMGIAKSQGSNDPEDCKKPAGNLFSQLTINDYWSIWNDCESIEYYSHSSSSSPYVVPSKTTNTKVFETELIFIEETCCPPNSTSGGGTGIIDGNTSSYKSEAESASQVLSALIDDGNTIEKVMDVNSAAPTEALIVRDDLLQTSPYVSDSVLKTAINREELLNNAMIRDIMVANPHSAKSETMMQELDMRLDPMPDYMKDEILEGVFVLSAKELMEAKRDMSERLYNYGFNRLLSVALTDTLVTPVDTVMALLSADGSAVSLMKQAWLVLERGDTTAALNRMEAIAGEIILTETELTELAAQYAFMQWLAENQSTDTLDIEPLNTFMLNSCMTVSSAARSILVANNLLSYQEPYLEPDLSKSSEIRKPRLKPVIPDDALLKVYPNPGRDFITIGYNLGNNNTIGSIEIVDQSGRKLFDKNLGNQFDQIVLDTRDFKPGSYLISLVDGNKSIISTRFVISR